MSDRIIELKVQNQRLKREVESLENKILNLVGMIEIFHSGSEDQKNVINDKLINLIHSSDEYINVITPKVDNFYTKEILNAVEKGLTVTIIINERSGIPPRYQPNYDQLRSNKKINVINNPNVRYILMFNEKEAIYCGGSLDRDELERSILIVTKIKVKDKLKEVSKIFNLMLPSFMRK